MQWHHSYRSMNCTYTTIVQYHTNSGIAPCWQQKMETPQETSKTIEVQKQAVTNEIETTAPGKLRVIKRNGKVVAFEEDKIKVAITKAFLAI